MLLDLVPNLKQYISVGVLWGGKVGLAGWGDGGGTPPVSKCLVPQCR